MDRGGFLKIKKFHISPSPPADLRCKFEGHLDIDRENNIERMYFWRHINSDGKLDINQGMAEVFCPIRTYFNGGNAYIPLPSGCELEVIMPHLKPPLTKQISVALQALFTSESQQVFRIGDGWNKLGTGSAFRGSDTVMGSSHQLNWEGGMAWYDLRILQHFPGTAHRGGVLEIQISYLINLQQIPNRRQNSFLRVVCCVKMSQFISLEWKGFSSGRLSRWWASPAQESMSALVWLAGWDFCLLSDKLWHCWLSSFHRTLSARNALAWGVENPAAIVLIWRTGYQY